MLEFIGSFFGLVFIVFIVVSILLVVAMHSAEKREENEKKKREEQYRNSSAIKKISEVILNTSPLPVRIEVHSYGVKFFEYGEYREDFELTDLFIFEADFNLKNIPFDCIGAVAQALVESPELQSLYAFSGKEIHYWDDSDNRYDFCELDLKYPQSQPPMRPQSQPEEW